jgi:hypothetical protein
MLFQWTALDNPLLFREDVVVNMATGMKHYTTLLQWNPQGRT